MRILFYPTTQSNVDNRYETVNRFDLVQETIPPIYMAFDNYVINWLDTYEDGGRYQLNVYDVQFDRCYANQSYSFGDDRLIHNGLVRVFEIDLNFVLDFDFKLFSDHYVDVWNNSLEIKAIKPLITSYTNDKKLAYVAFNSIATSYFAKLVNLLDTNNIMCQKIGNKIVLAFFVDEHTDANTNLALDYFIDAIYEIVKSTVGRLDYEVPESKYVNQVNLKEWYDKRRKKNRQDRDVKVVY